jgi:hypothetical protein
VALNSRSIASVGAVLGHNIRLPKRSALTGRLLALQAIAGPIWHTMADQR